MIGESGAGKSTIGMSSMGFARGQLEITGGEILLNGRDLRGAGRKALNALRGTEVSYVAQSAAAAFNPAHKLIDQVIEATQKHGIMPSPETIGDRYPHQVSGGQLQRVCIARALAAKPRLIICDEVTSALDPLVADGILQLLDKLQKEEGVAYLFITHDLATVKAIADSIAVMHQGRLVRYGSKHSVLSPPFDDYTDKLLSSIPEMELGWLDSVIVARESSS